MTEARIEPWNPELTAGPAGVLNSKLIQLTLPPVAGWLARVARASRAVTLGIRVRFPEVVGFEIYNKRSLSLCSEDGSCSLKTVHPLLFE